MMKVKLLVLFMGVFLNACSIKQTVEKAELPELMQLKTNSLFGLVYG